MAVAIRLVLKLIYLGVSAWLLASGALFLAMLLPPEMFASVVAKAPAMLVQRVLPFRPLWGYARRGSLQIGDQAPDFDLERHDHAGRVRLTSFVGHKPVVLVFGSYT